jgi:ABC-type bacteriocin/lantibiotic exporter with double-glycine peptidase domain
MGAAFCFCGGKAPMRRIVIIGQPGSGKSTLARGLGRVTGLPVMHIGHIHWRLRRVRRHSRAIIRSILALTFPFVACTPSYPA